MRKIFAILAFVFATSASASSLTSEITDMWWVPSESGWGLNVILQNGTAFVTFFVYDANRNPVWYTAQLSYQGEYVWSGSLYATNGPWFGGPFPPNTTVRQAGTATFSMPTDLRFATLTYSVDGVTVTKAVQRQTWTNENYSGTYAGGYSIRMSQCNPASMNGVQEVAGVIAISQSGTSVAFSAPGPDGSSCSFSGTYVQTGKLGSVQGVYACTDSSQGTFFAFEMTPTRAGFTGQFRGQNQFCQWIGHIGGIARAQ